MTANPDPVDLIDGIDSTDDVSKSETRAELKAVLRRFDSVDEVGSTDLSDRYAILLGGYVYLKNTASTEEADGSTIVVDGNGINWYRIAATSLDARGPYDNGEIYQIGQWVTYSSSSWYSIVADNIGHTPAIGSLFWGPLAFGATGPKGDGLDYDLGPVADNTARDALVGVTAGQRVAVSDVGSGRSAIYELVSAGPYVWSDPLYITPDTVAASNSTAGVTKVSTSASMATGTATDEAARVADVAANFVGQGQHEIGHWPARALTAATTSGAGALATLESSSNKVNDEYISFVNASTTYAGFSFRAPKKLDRTVNFTVEMEWTEASGAAAHDCKWQVEMQAQGDADTIDSAWGTAVTVVDTGSSGTRRFALTGTVTPAGSWAAGDKIHVRVARLGADGSDTLDVDARLIGVTLFAGVNLKNDA